MRENKRFTLVNHNEYADGDLIYYDDGEEMGSLDVVDRLNELNDENNRLKKSLKISDDLILFIYNEIKEEGSMDYWRIKDLIEF